MLWPRSLRTVEYDELLFSNPLSKEENKLGYSHYYEWDVPLQDASTKFPQWSKEVELILDEVQRRGIVVWDREGSNAVIVDPEFVLVNGPVKDDQGHEAFYLGLEDCLAPLNWQAETRPFCKTAGKPYDVAVVAALIQFSKHFPDAQIHSDGGPHDWQEGLELCQHLFGDDAGLIPDTIEAF